MEWALKDGLKVKAKPEEKGNCPICNEKLIAKCGEIKIWHWSHKNNNDCDTWSEPESKWHIDWKNEFPIENQEVLINKNNILHIADIKINNNIIELQNSSLSYEEIQEREQFYENMIWILNGENLFGGLELREKWIEEKQKDLNGKESIKSNRKIITFRLRSPAKSWWFAKKPIYVHLIGNMGRKKESYYDGIATYSYKRYQQQWRGDKLFLVKKIYNKIPCGGWGEIIDKKDFLKRYLHGDNRF